MTGAPAARTGRGTRSGGAGARAGVAVAAATAALAACTAGPGATPGSGTADGSGQGGSAGTALTVFAAASLVDVAEQVIDAVEAEHPDLTVSLSLAGSSDLVSQVVSGAPADVLVTADETTMARAVEADAVEQPVVVALNHPVLVVPAGNAAHVTGLDDSLEDAVLVVCAPQVPCGAATGRVEQASGVTLNPVSEESSVTDVLNKVSSGQADAGLVYVTDVAGSAGKVVAVDFPEATDAVNTYPIAALRDAGNVELARRFVGYVTGEVGQRVLGEAGFGRP